jgi:AraC-like DNA-binding protein
MRLRAFEDWQHLIEEQIASELSVPKFSQQHHISPSYFYSRKSMIGKESKNVGIIQANVIAKQIARI